MKPTLKVPTITPQQKREQAFDEIFVHCHATAALYAKSKFSKEEAAVGKAFLAYLDSHKAEMKKAVVS